MFYEVVIRAVVHADISELAEYSYKFHCNSNTVKKIYDQLYYAMASLNLMPNRFETYH